MHLSVVSLLFAVDKTTKVRVFTLMALVDRATMVCILLGLSVVITLRISHSLIVQDTLILSTLQSQFLYTFFQSNQRFKFVSNWLLQTLKLDLLVA